MWLDVDYSFDLWVLDWLEFMYDTINVVISSRIPVINGKFVVSLSQRSWNRWYWKYSLLWSIGKTTSEMHLNQIFWQTIWSYERSILLVDKRWLDMVVNSAVRWLSWILDANPYESMVYPFTQETFEWLTNKPLFEEMPISQDSFSYIWHVWYKDSNNPDKLYLDWIYSLQLSEQSLNLLENSGVFYFPTQEEISNWETYRGVELWDDIIKSYNMVKSKWLLKN